RIDKNDAAAILGNHGRPDMLRNASGFAGGDLGLANGIEQAGLAMVDVAHDGDHRGPRLEIFLLLFFGNFLDDFFFEGDDGDDATEGFGETGCRGDIQGLIDGGKDAPVEKIFQDIFGAHVQLFSEFADGDALGDGDFARRTGRLRNRFDARGAALGDAGTRANGVQLAFAFFKALFESGTGASRGLAFVNRLAGFRLGRRHDGQRQYRCAGAHRPLSGARGNAARTNGYRSWTSAGVADGHASAGGTHTGTSCRCSGRSAAGTRGNAGRGRSSGDRGTGSC